MGQTEFSFDAELCKWNEFVLENGIAPVPQAKIENIQPNSCQICGERGTLLNCIRCHKKFHKLCVASDKYDLLTVNLVTLFLFVFFF